MDTPSKQNHESEFRALISHQSNNLKLARELNARIDNLVTVFLGPQDIKEGKLTEAPVPSGLLGEAMAESSGIHGVLSLIESNLIKLENAI